MDVPLSNMDRVTQLEEGIDMLLKIMAASISYLSRKADFKQLHPLVPPTVRAPDAVDDATMQESTRELVEDLVQKAKEVEVLIAALPAPTETEEEQAAELAALEEQVQVANREYRDALSEAGEY